VTARLYGLLALRHQVEALIAMEEADAVLSQSYVIPQDQTVCAHPEDKRLSKTTFGTEPSFLCTECGEVVKGQA
jgi:hypothetical protein